VSKPQ